MRTTLRIDSDLLVELRAAARAEGISLNRLLNRLLRRGLGAGRSGPPRRRFRQAVHSLGQPPISLDKALGLAAALEDAEVVRKLAMRK
jgi:hypothetical protein